MTSYADRAPSDGPGRSIPLRDWAVDRQTMVDCQIRTFDVTDQRVIARFLAVPREHFMPEDVRDLAYSDIGFTLKPTTPTGEARYLLPPLILARLIQGGRVKPSDRVLDVACGTGYSTAILSGLAVSVVALEADGHLKGELDARLGTDGPNRAVTLSGDLAAGTSESGPFDVILVNGAVEANLEALRAQLAEGGRLLVIERAAKDPTGRAAKAICYERRGGEFGARYLFDASAPVLRAFRRAPGFTF